MKFKNLKGFKVIKKDQQKSIKGGYPGPVNDLCLDTRCYNSCPWDLPEWLCYYECLVPCK